VLLLYPGTVLSGRTAVLELPEYTNSLPGTAPSPEHSRTLDTYIKSLPFSLDTP
jgi:hypothetical protein